MLSSESARTAQHRQTPAQIARSSRPLHRAPRAACRASRARASSLCCAALAALATAAVPSFEVLRVPGDGSCLFRALAQGRAVLERGPHPTPAHFCPAMHPSLHEQRVALQACLEQRGEASFGVPAGGGLSRRECLGTKTCTSHGQWCVRMPGRPLDHHALLREGYELRQGIVASLLARRAEVEPFITGRHIL